MLRSLLLIFTVLCAFATDLMAEIIAPRCRDGYAAFENKTTTSFAPGASLSRYEIRDKAALYRKLSQGGDQRLFATYLGWSQKIQARPGYVYRGMALSQNDLQVILSRGMLLSKASFIYPGIFAAHDIEVTIPYALALRRADPKRPLGVLFEIDPAGLETKKFG